MSLLRRVIWEVRGFYNRMLGALSILASLPGGFKAIVARLKEQEAEIKLAMGEIDAHLTSTDKNLLFSSVGRALSAWAAMEEALVLLVSFLLKVDPNKAGLIMYHIINFSVWLMLIDELFDLEPQAAPYRKKWNKISERLRKIKDQRDQLAHHSIERKQGFGEIAFLTPSDLDVRRKSKRQRPLSKQEVTEFTETVADISQRLTELLKSMIAGQRQQRVASASPETDHSPPSDIQ